MKNKSLVVNIVFSIIGLLVLVLGLILLKTYLEGSTIAYISIGFGCGIFGHAFGGVIERITYKKHPELQKQREIEASDERNTAITNKAQSKAFNIMIYVFGALFVAFALMNVDLKVILLLIGAYLFVCGASVYYRIKYEKEM